MRLPLTFLLILILPALSRPQRFPISGRRGAK
jgi:hypothetical protein